MRAKIKSLRTIRDRDQYSVTYSIEKDKPRLCQIAPALDRILTRPGNPAHSEFNRLTQLIHELLVDSILTNKALNLYHKTLRSF
jgi:hypothetical protein